MGSTPQARSRWSLADLIDFEALLAVEPGGADARDRMLFARDIRPRLPADDELARRRAGLRLWLDSRRERQTLETGDLWGRGLALLRLALFAFMGFAGFTLVAGLCAGHAQSVHVLFFFALTLIVPWAVFLFWRFVRGIGGRRPVGSAKVVALIIGVIERLQGARTRSAFAGWRRQLADGTRARRVFAAALTGVLQWGGLGFTLGLVLAFAGALMVFDVRFYWEATPQTGALIETAADAVAVPWNWVWPAAVPDTAAVAASRARYVDGSKHVPDDAAANAAWWRFLLMSLLVWGVLPRLVLIGVSRWQLRRALARLDFQAPRHRALWRALTAVERGAVAPVAADGALVLDVGGIGLDMADVRGFLLRGLRVNPEAVERVGVLDEAAESAADAALADGPAQVVVLVEGWNLAPRQAGALHKRIRRVAGARTLMHWLVLARLDNAPVPPKPDHFERWVRFIDGLRDPATEVVAYDPSI